MTQGSQTEGGSPIRRILDIKASELPGTHAAAGCRKCSCEDGYFGRYIQRNHKVALRWVCGWCEDYGTSGDLPLSLLGDFPLNELPLRVDHSPQYDPPECQVCQQPADEYHHWAPTSVFPDWPYNLGIYLCTDHHREWHDRMRAHGFRYPHELQDVS